MADNPWGIAGWGAARGQIQAAVEFLCEGKSAEQRADIGEEIASLVRAVAKGAPPSPRADPLLDSDEAERESWARHVADHLVGAAMVATERTVERTADKIALLREIAKKALWHIPNSEHEARKLVAVMTIENLKQPHPGDSA